MCLSRIYRTLNHHLCLNNRSVSIIIKALKLFMTQKIANHLKSLMKTNAKLNILKNAKFLAQILKYRVLQIKIRTRISSC